MAKKVRNKFLNSVADTLELIVRDLSGQQRSRKERRYTRAARPIVIVTVIK